MKKQFYSLPLLALCLFTCLALTACQAPTNSAEPTPNSSTTDQVQTTPTVANNPAGETSETNSESETQDNQQVEQPDTEKPTRAPNEDQQQERSVGLKTTFTQLLEWGLSEADIESILGIELPEDLDMRLKDYCESAGIDVNALIAQFQIKVDDLN